MDNPKRKGKRKRKTYLGKARIKSKVYGVVLLTLTRSVIVVEIILILLFKKNVEDELGAVRNSNGTSNTSTSTTATIKIISTCTSTFSTTYY